MTLAITGLTGEIGHFLIDEMKNLPKEVVDLYHTRKFEHPAVTQHQDFDLLKTEAICTTLEKIHPDIIIHMAGATHIDICEADRVNKENGNVWKMNVLATAEVAKYCFAHNCHLIYLSTECVFDGSKDSYQEMDIPHPLNWYGVTKAEAEKQIINSGSRYTIIRAVIAYHPKAKNTLWQKIVKRIESQGSILMATDNQMTPTYLLDIVKVIDKCVKNPLGGILHVASNTSYTPFRFAQKISQALGYSNQAVQPARLAEIIGESKAKLRLKNACLDTKKTEKLLKMKFNTIDTVLSNL